MYRVKAEAVSGKSVFADGKWLRCIGNKIVRAGDFVWTDGRCVYGNHKEAQQPLVITAPDNDTAIPIITQLGHYPTLERQEYFTYDKRLKAVKRNVTDSPDPYTSFTRIRKMINDRKGNVYWTRFYYRNYFYTQWGIIAANIDKYNNFYAIRINYKPNGNHFVEIIKNELVVDSFYSDICRIPVLERVSARCTFLQGEHPYNDSPFAQATLEFCNGIIEDENNWALMVEVDAYAYADTEEKVGESIHHGLDVERYHYHTTSENSNFLISPSGVIKLYHIEQESIEHSAADWYDLSGSHHLIEREYSSQKSAAVDAPQQKIPLQDGYYYLINKVTLPERWAIIGDFNATLSAHFSLFTPTGEIILGETDNNVMFPLGARITICKLSKDNYLIGIEFNITLPDNEVVKAGLYSCKQGILTLIKDGNCRTHKLRPMKKYKNWQNRIKDFPIPEI